MACIVVALMVAELIGLGVRIAAGLATCMLGSAGRTQGSPRPPLVDQDLPPRSIKKLLLRSLIVLLRKLHRLLLLSALLLSVMECEQLRHFVEASGHRSV